MLLQQRDVVDEPRLPEADGQRRERSPLQRVQLHERLRVRDADVVDVRQRLPRESVNFPHPDTGLLPARGACRYPPLMNDLLFRFWATNLVMRTNWFVAVARHVRGPAGCGTQQQEVVSHGRKSWNQVLHMGTNTSATTTPRNNLPSDDEARAHFFGGRSPAKTAGKAA